MGAQGSITMRTPRAVLRSDLQLHLKAGSVTKNVAELLQRWFEDGAPLALNLEMFQEVLDLGKGVDVESFFKAFDTDANRKVDVLEVLSATIFLANGSIDEKIEAIHPVFDFTNNHAYTFDELDIFLNSFCRGLTKACGLPIVSPDELIVACRQMYDAYNLPYSQEVTREQVKRWVQNDVEASHFMRAFHLARSLSEVEAELARRERAQAEIFSQLSRGTASAAHSDFLHSQSFHDSLGNPPEEELRNFVRLIADSGGGAVQLDRFVEAARAWNAFDAVDVEKEGVVHAPDIFLLLWYQQHEEPSAEAVKQKCLALGVESEQSYGVIDRARWLASISSAA